MRNLLVLAGLAAVGFASAQVFPSDQTDIRVPGTGTGGTTTGSAGVYPITFNVSGVGGPITDVNIGVIFGSNTDTTDAPGKQHTWSDDLDMLLVSPSGIAVLFWSDAGGSANPNGLYLFDDEALGTITDGNPAGAPTTNDPLPNGSYQVSSYGTGDVFLAPAPAGPWGSSLSDFDGSNANGVWSLYIMDDTGGDFGWLNGARLEIEAVPEPATMLALGAGLVALARRRRK